MNELISLSDADICAVVGIRLKTERLRIGLSQMEISEKSGIALRTYKRFESTGKGSTETLIAALRQLDKLKLLDVLLPAPSLPPQNTNKQRLEKLRKRIRHGA